MVNVGLRRSFNDSSQHLVLSQSFVVRFYVGHDFYNNKT